MAKYTVQTFADSGNRANPDGRQSLIWADSLAAVKDAFLDWVDEVSRYDDPRDAYAYVWKGEYLRDVTDLYPDWKLTLGARLGIRRESV